VLVFINKKGKNVFTRWGTRPYPKPKKRKLKHQVKRKLGRPHRSLKKASDEAGSKEHHNWRPGEACPRLARKSAQIFPSR
jgi:hypothetical protein